MIVSAVLLLGAVSLAQGYEIPTISNCTINVKTDKTMVFKEVPKCNNGNWSFMIMPDTVKYENVDNMWAEFTETSENGKYVMTVYETQKGGEPQKHLPIILRDLGCGRATMDANIDGKDTQLNVSVLYYKKDEIIYYLLCSVFGGDLEQHYRFALCQGKPTKEQEEKIKCIDEEHGFKGKMKKLY